MAERFLLCTDAWQVKWNTACAWSTHAREINLNEPKVVKKTYMEESTVLFSLHHIETQFLTLLIKNVISL